MKRRFIEIEEFELDKPDAYEEILRNADGLFAELLMRYYLFIKNSLTNVNDSRIIDGKKGEGNEQLPISNRDSRDSGLHEAGNSKENLEGIY